MASVKMGLPQEMSPKTIEVIKATAPVVAPKALEITTNFYAEMFTKRPDLFKFFNKANQATGIQPKTLAAAIVAYASHIDKLDAIAGFHASPVDVMCHKHCALDIQPEHYQVVHDELMGAVGRVLGDAVTPEIGSAWSESVLFLAKVLIDREEQLYAEAEKRSGGWRSFKPFEVVEIEQVSDGVKRFKFAPPKGEEQPAGGYDFEIGQFISVRIDPNGDGLTAPRHYTLTSSPGDKALECTIKRVESGVVSSYLHDKVKVGDVLDLCAPFGCFTPHESENKVVLISNGIGVTPMVNFSKKFKSRLALVAHVDSSPATHAYASKFEGCPTLFKYSSEGGRVSAEKLIEEIYAQSAVGDAPVDFYLCGSPGFQAGVEEVLKTKQGATVYSEAFKGHSDV